MATAMNNYNLAVTAVVASKTWAENSMRVHLLSTVADCHILLSALGDATVNDFLLPQNTVVTFDVRTVGGSVSAITDAGSGTLYIAIET